MITLTKEANQGNNGQYHGQNSNVRFLPVTATIIMKIPGMKS